MVLEETTEEGRLFHSGIVLGKKGHHLPNTKITITDNLDWGQHVSEISCKANKTMGMTKDSQSISWGGGACWSTVYRCVNKGPQNLP